MYSRKSQNTTERLVYHDDDDAVYNDDGWDYADLLHPVQVLKNHLRHIHG